MKKTLLLICFLLIINSLCHIQGVHFEKSTFETALTKAKETDKLLFVDVYTSWCGPCKRMARETFTQNIVGKYFNEHFINYQQDGEKGNGPEIMKKYNIHAVPTFLFLDGNGNRI